MNHEPKHRVAALKWVVLLLFLIALLFPPFMASLMQDILAMWQFYLIVWLIPIFYFLLISEGDE